MDHDSCGKSCCGGVSVPVMAGLIVAVFALAIIALFYAARSGAAHSASPAENTPVAVR